MNSSMIIAILIKKLGGSVTITRHDAESTTGSELQTETCNRTGSLKLSVKPPVIELEATMLDGKFSVK